MATSPAVTLRQYNTALEFVNALSPTGPVFGPGDYRDVIPPTRAFRGHADERWSLLPSALRLTSEDLRRKRSGGGVVEPPTNSAQARRERNALVSFWFIADRQGLFLPGDSERFSEVSAQIDAPPDWPPRWLWPALGLIQHHGVPTRLLDWTRSGYVAAYFAAVKASRWVLGLEPNSEKATHLAVWAIGEPFLVLAVEGLTRSLRGPSPGKLTKGTVYMVTVPEFGNPNLHAQQGFFTLYVPYGLDPNAFVDLRPLENIIEEEFTVTGVLTKLVLPIEEAPRLLTLLARYDVTGASLFPGYDGVVKEMQEHEIWNEDGLRELGRDAEKAYDENPANSRL